MATLSPKLAQLLNASIAHHQTGRLDAAADGYARVLAASPRHFQALHLSGAVALQRGEAKAAALHLMRAIRVQPTSAPSWMCLGLAHSALGDREQAETCLRRSLELEPRNAEAWGNLGAILVVAGRIPEAIDAYRRSVDVSPAYVAGWTGLGATLLVAGRAGEALAQHERALQLKPDHGPARYGRALALLACQRVEEAQADFATYLSRHPDHHQARSYWLFTRNYSDSIPATQLFQDHVEFGRRIRVAATPAAHDRRDAGPTPMLRNDPNPERRLRLAFLSPDLRAHSIAHFLEPLLAHLDREQFEITLYHDHFKTDEVTDRLKRHAASFHNFVGQPDAIVETLIRADQQDILVDLSGHCSFNRLPLYARRLAPVQVNYLGYPNTTGLPAMDYRLTDAVVDPPDIADPLHTERLLRFAPTAWSYQPPHDTPEVVPPPASAGRPVTFGSFNNAAKLNTFTLRLWARILAEVPGARLVLKSYGLARADIEPRLVEAGIDPKRVDVLSPRAATAEHLACYHQVDITLDPYPYAGTTTTCEALWMGRPVITLAGKRHASRVGVSLLHAIGRPEWVAKDADEYVACAARLAADPSQLAGASAGLRGAMSGSPLLDHPGQAQRFSTALREAWRAWCATRSIATHAA